MLSSKLKRNVLVAAACASLAFGAVACSSASASSPSTTTEVACNEVSDQLVSAQSQLTDAQAAAEEAKDTPGESEANDAATAAQDQVNNLTARQTTCATETTASPTPEAITSASTVASTVAITVVTTAPVDAGEFSNQFNAIFTGFNPGEIGTGTQGVDFNAHTETHGDHDFSGTTLKTQADVAAFLNGSSAESIATKQRVTDAIKAAGYGDADVARALDGSGYFPVQAKVASQFSGTTYFVDGNVYEVADWRASDSGDIFWLFLTGDGKQIVVGATVRADCGNPDLEQVRPIRADTPWAPPAICAQGDCEQQPPTPPADSGCQSNCDYTPPTSCEDTGTCDVPTCPNGTPVPSNGLCHKVVSDDPQSRGNVPSGSSRTAPEVDNQQEISRGEVAPVDQGNGIPSGATAGPAAPRSTPAPAPTQVQGTTALPSPTQAPAPASTTAVQTGMPAELPPPG